jgi:hypothetical protein
MTRGELLRKAREGAIASGVLDIARDERPAHTRAGADQSRSGGQMPTRRGPALRVHQRGRSWGRQARGDQQTRPHPERAWSPSADHAPPDRPRGVRTDTYSSSSSTPAGAGWRSCNSG